MLKIIKILSLLIAAAAGAVGAVYLATADLATADLESIGLPSQDSAETASEENGPQTADHALDGNGQTPGPMLEGSPGIDNESPYQAEDEKPLPQGPPSARYTSNPQAGPQQQAVVAAPQAPVHYARHPAYAPYPQTMVPGYAPYANPYAQAPPNLAETFEKLDAIKALSDERGEMIKFLQQQAAAANKKAETNPPPATAINQGSSQSAANQPASIGGQEGHEGQLPQPPRPTAGPVEIIPEPLANQPAKIYHEEGDEGLVVNIQNSDIREVLELLSQEGNLNILAGPSVTGTVSASLTGVDVQSALDAILTSTGYGARREGNFIYVGTPEELKRMQHQRDTLGMRVYQPNYVSSADLQQLITPMLTESVGSVTVSAPSKVDIAPDSNSSGGNDYAGNDVVLVRDYEQVLLQVDALVAQVDRMPTQVAIEAMILSVTLDDSLSTGVDFELLQNNLILATGAPLSSLGNLELTEGGLKFGYLDGSFGAFVEALETVGETSVIAAPRVLCLNKQKAEILIGRQLGYVSTTITETAATQSVEFLEVGTQLRIRPFISDDGMIRMEVHPELSTGQVRVEGSFTLPDKDLTQVTTNVMCRDGSTVVIGGLIREDLSNTGSQVPFFGNIPILGTAFRRSKQDNDRRELIVLLTPRVISDPLLGAEGQAEKCKYLNRQSIYADKLSPIGKRYFGRKYFRMAEAAWLANDYDDALRLVNLSIHFNAASSEAIQLRANIIAATNPALDLHHRLNYGLGPSKKLDYTIHTRQPADLPCPTPYPGNGVISIPISSHASGCYPMSGYPMSGNPMSGNPMSGNPMSGHGFTDHETIGPGPSPVPSQMPPAHMESRAGEERVNSASVPTNSPPSNIRPATAINDRPQTSEPVMKVKYEMPSQPLDDRTNANAGVPAWLPVPSAPITK